MKKLYSLLLIALPFCSFAQPTITQADEPVINLAIGTAIDPTYTGPAPSSGATQTWDYSTLQLVDTGGAYFLDVEGTPFQTTFPEATLCTHDVVKDEWLYFRGAADGFYVEGVDSAGVILDFNPAWMYLPAQFTFGDTRNNRGRAQIDSVVDFGFGPIPARLIHTVDDTFTGEGYGTLQVPGNTFTNTLLIKDKQVTTDTVLANFGAGYQEIPGVPPTVSQGHTYRWVRHNGPDAFLLELRADSLGTTCTRSEYQVISIISVPEINKERVHVTPYPNPTSDAINISFEKGVSGDVKVYNSLNQLVRTSSFTDISHYTMYVNTLADGNYHFTVATSDNKIREGSFVVSH